MDRNRHGGGVCIYVKSTLHAERCSEFEDSRMECILLKIRVFNKAFYFACVYRPPNSNNEFWQALSESVEKVKENDNPNIFIFGDLNSNILCCRSKIHEFVKSCNLSKLITEPTRIPSNTIIDLILTNAPLMIINHGVLDPLCSDHKPIYACLNYTLHSSPVYKRLLWDFKNSNFDIFRFKLEEVNWENLMTGCSLDECVSLFTNTFIDIAKTYLTNKTVTIRNRDKPWLHNEIRKQIRIRKRIHKTAKRFDTPDHWNLYRRQRNKVIGLIRNAKQMYYRRLSEKLGSHGSISSKEWWKLCKFIYTGKTSDHSIPPLNLNNEIIVNDVDKAEAFNDYFGSISHVIDANATIDEPVTSTDYELSSISITCHDVKYVLLNLKLNKACGLDMINHRLLKESVNIISKPLTCIFNKSLSLGRFHNQWKMANLVPIHKANEKNLHKNYRPISLLSCLGKVFERCIFKYLFNYLRDNRIVSIHQSGFIPGDSTVNQRVSIHHDLCKALENHNGIQLIFFDISKAFDKVWHKGLLHKLKCIGIKGPLYQLFHDYLDNRKQRVVLNGKCSSWQTINAGVPQGSVLGPLMFLIYINDIGNNLSSTATLFADDTSLSKHIIDDYISNNEIQDDLDTIQAWASKWKVIFNPLKSESMLVSLRRNTERGQNFTFQNHVINNVDIHKHLGLTLNSDASWKSHLSTIIARASKRIDMLRALKFKLDRSSLEKMYFAYIRPIFEYASVVWDSAPRHEYYFATMEKLQIAAARIVTGTNTYASKQLLYHDTGWERLSTRRQNQRLFLLFKIVNGLAPPHLINLLDTYLNVNQMYDFRSTNIPIPRARTETYRCSFFLVQFALGIV